MAQVEYSIKNRDKLLSDLAALLCKGKDHGGRLLHMFPLVNLKVTLYRGKRKLYEILGAEVALQYLMEDIYWSEDASWADADRLTVEVY
jgi:hypothetical protein